MNVRVGDIIKLENNQFVAVSVRSTQWHITVLTPTQIHTFVLSLLYIVLYLFPGDLPQLHRHTDTLSFDSLSHTDTHTLISSPAWGHFY